MSNPAVFLDKDGTLIEDVPYNVDPRHVRFLQGSRDGVRRLHEAGYRIVVVTNQSGVARGLFDEPQLRAVAEHIRDVVAGWGVPLSGFYYCPHLVEGTVPEYSFDCECRKPAPGLIHQAARELDLDLSRSWFVGDILGDVEAGKAAGCRTILVETGKPEEEKEKGALPIASRPDHRARDLTEAAWIILSSGNAGRLASTARHHEADRRHDEVGASAGGER